MYILLCITAYRSSEERAVFQLTLVSLLIFFEVNCLCARQGMSLALVFVWSAFWYFSRNIISLCFASLYCLLRSQSSVRSSSLSSARRCFMCSALSYRLCPALMDLDHGCPYSKGHGASMRSTWVLSAPDGPQVGPIDLTIRVHVNTCRRKTYLRRLWCLSCIEFRIKALSYAAHVVSPRDILFPVVIFAIDAWRKAI